MPFPPYMGGFSAGMVSIFETRDFPGAACAAFPIVAAQPGDWGSYGNQFCAICGFCFPDWPKITLQGTNHGSKGAANRPPDNKEKTGGN
ncbi:hypothetical protein K3725_07375 [Leisingera sp. S132]|uniref:hypothetical protein n=1 Tax=Leisingera sp. S132 TaxID=2867016 RepID=UPI0021A3602B|nr:hypothetical protein [Leisingera sp. S132]UWQ80807.1 hypothetical protein K3725_07375 [Leisingera sp. S132]